jgi:hypothetical protein
MTIIQGGISQVGMDVGSVSKGGYTECVDANGRKVAPLEVYSVAFDIAPSTLTDGTTYLSLRNSGARVALLRKAEFFLTFTGTVASSVSSYRFERASGSAPTGGTALVVAKRKTTNPTSTIDARFANGGVTTSGATFESSFHRIGHLNQLQSVALDIDMTEFGEGSYFTLDTGEGMVLRASGAVIAGSRLIGSISWAERVA